MGRRSQIKSLGYPDEMTKKEIDTSKKKDKDFMQQLKIFKRKRRVAPTYRLVLFYTQKTGGTLMDSQKFIDLCKKRVVDFANSQLDYTDQKNKRV